MTLKREARATLLDPDGVIVIKGALAHVPQIRAIRIHNPDLKVQRPIIRLERDLFAVRRPRRTLFINKGIAAVRDLAIVLIPQIIDVDFVVSRLAADERDTAAIGRPRGIIRNPMLEM